VQKLNKIPTAELMRAYWLGSLTVSDAENAIIEWLKNDEDCELLEVAKFDLIEDYSTDNLTDAELQFFKQNFLPHNLEEVAVSKTYFETRQKTEIKSPHPSVFDRLKQFFAQFILTPQFALASVLLLVSIFAANRLFFNRSVAETDYIAENNPPNYNPQNDKPSESDAVDSGQNKIRTHSDNQNNRRTTANVVNTFIDKKSEPEKPKNSPEKTAALALQIISLSGLRGNEKVPEPTTVSTKAKFIAVELNVPDRKNNEQTYELSIKDDAGNLIAKQDLTKEINSKLSGKRISAKFSTDKFKKDITYIITLTSNRDKANPTDYKIHKTKQFKVL
jgi:hypothetical protein